MHNRLSFRKIIKCGICEYHKWIFNEKLIIVLMLVVFNYLFAVEPLIERANIMNCNVNILEPYIAVGNSNVLLLIVPTVFLVLICDFPKTDGNMAIYISRIGRKNWAAGQILMLVMAAVSYILILALSAIIPILLNCYSGDQWSKAVTDFSILYPEESMSYTLLPENLYFQMTVFEAALHTFCFSILYLIVIGLIMLCAAFLKNKGIGYIISAFIMAIGTALCTFTSDGMWYFPMAHAITWLHFTKFVRKEVVTLGKSYLYFVMIIAILVVAIWFLVPRYNYDKISED